MIIADENVLGLPPWWISFDQTFKFESLIIRILQQQDFNALESESKSRRPPAAKNYWISNSSKTGDSVDEMNFSQTWWNAIRNNTKCKLFPKDNNEWIGISQNIAQKNINLDWFEYLQTTK